MMNSWRRALTTLLPWLMSACVGQVAVDTTSDDRSPSRTQQNRTLEAPDAGAPTESAHYANAPPESRPDASAPPEAERDAGPSGEEGPPGDSDVPTDSGQVVVPTQGCGDATESSELTLTNAARAAEGVRALACDDLLTRVARAHSQDMCDHGYFSHTDLKGGSFADRIVAAGGSFRAGGENIARGQLTPEAVHASWMKSPGHRANILASEYGHVGIGYVPCGGDPYWTQVFTD